MQGLSPGTEGVDRRLGVTEYVSVNEALEISMQGNRTSERESMSRCRPSAWRPSMALKRSA
jgi:hypothetical protein